MTLFSRAIQSKHRRYPNTFGSLSCFGFMPLQAFEGSPNAIEFMTKSVLQKCLAPFSAQTVKYFGRFGHTRLRLFTLFRTGFYLHYGLLAKQQFAFSRQMKGPDLS